MTVLENLTLAPVQVLGALRRRRQRQQRAMELLDRVGPGR